MPTDTTNITFRPATPADVPRFVELITGANLPPLFIEQYLDGFIAAERAGAVIACGGVELYGECAVIRSVVVDASARGLGLGKKIADMLIARSRQAACTDLYLFTGDAVDFWQHMGFTGTTFDGWKDDARACWQYQFLSQNQDIVPDIHTMWRPA